MAAALALTAILGGCVAQGAARGAAPVVPVAASSGPLRVTNAGAPFANFEGGAARRMAEAECSARGQRLVSSIYDRYEAGAWVFVEGCA